MRVTVPMLSAFGDQLEKQSRSLLKDFAAGVDPTGASTFGYGIQDAHTSDADASRRRAVGMAGGMVGGAVAIPAAVGGVTGAIKGYTTGGLRGAARGVASGMKQPFTSVYRGVRGVRALGSAAKKGISGADVQSLDKLTGAGQSIGALESAAGPTGLSGALRRAHKTGLSAQQVRALDQDGSVVGAAARELKGETAAGIGALGLSGVIGAGSAGLQYNKGQKFGRPLTQEQRDQMK